MGEWESFWFRSVKIRFGPLLISVYNRSLVIIIIKKCNKCFGATHLFFCYSHIGQVWLPNELEAQQGLQLKKKKKKKHHRGQG